MWKPHDQNVFAFDVWDARCDGDGDDDNIDDGDGDGDGGADGDDDDDDDDDHVRPFHVITEFLFMDDFFGGS